MRHRGGFGLGEGCPPQPEPACPPPAVFYGGRDAAPAGSAWRSRLLACALQVFCYVLALQVSAWRAVTSRILLQEHRGGVGKLLSASDVVTA